MEQIVFLIALAAFLLTIILFGVNVAKIGFMQVLSIKTRPSQMALGVMDIYIILLITLLVMMN